MPNMVYPEDGGSGGPMPSGTVIEIKSRGYEDRYPNGKNLLPKSPAHERILKRVMDMARDSWEIVQRRHSDWNSIDKTMTVYIPLSDYEKQLKKGSKSSPKDAMLDENRPVSIVVPYSYATFETLLTYMSKAYLVGGPIIEYEGTGGTADNVGAKLLELVVNHQVRRMGAVLPMHNAFGNSLKYGIGPTTFQWYVKHGYKSRMVPKRTFLDGMMIEQGEERQREEVVLYEGNRLQNIDPYRYLPDPNVSAENIDDMEFCGWAETVSIFNLLIEEQDDDTLFNIKIINDLYTNKGSGEYTQGKSSSIFGTDQSAREIRAGQSQGELKPKTRVTRNVTRLNLYAWIIPREWKLGRGDYPELWLFSIIDDEFVVRATPVELDHQSIPVACACPDSDGFSSHPLGRLEMSYGLQNTLNWMFNSHITNVRKVMNDMLVVDPSMIVMKDLYKPGAGKLLRLRRSAWGRSAKDAIFQLPVQDVTKGNIQDADFIMNAIQRLSAATDATQGMMPQGSDRRTAAEYRGTVSNAISRLEHMAMLIAWQYMNRISYLYASHTQQYMSEDVITQITGDMPQVLRQQYAGNMGGKLAVSAKDIMVDYDIKIKDGTVPTAGAINADVWTQLLQILLSDPTGASQAAFNIPKIFSHIAILLGATNVFDFLAGQEQAPPVNADVVSDEEAQAQAQAGNVVPLTALGG